MRLTISYKGIFSHAALTSGGYRHLSISELLPLSYIIRAAIAVRRNLARALGYES